MADIYQPLSAGSPTITSPQAMAPELPSASVSIPIRADLQPPDISHAELTGVLATLSASPTSSRIRAGRIISSGNTGEVSDAKGDAHEISRAIERPGDGKFEIDLNVLDERSALVQAETTRFNSVDLRPGDVVDLDGAAPVVIRVEPGTTFGGKFRAAEPTKSDKEGQVSGAFYFSGHIKGPRKGYIHGGEIWVRDLLINVTGKLVGMKRSSTPEAAAA